MMQGMVAALPRRRIAVTARRRPIAVDLHEPLLDAIAAAAPGDVAPWTVYADLLQTEEHPRGELMSLMLERERRPSVKLLDLERRQLAAHASVVMPRALDARHVVAWRRGFASELRLDAPEQLAVVAADPSLRFVEAATLVLADNKSWKKPLASARMPWRRLRIESETRTLKLAPIVAACPAVERLEIAGNKLDWSDVRAEHLTTLVLTGRRELGSLDDVHLPRLAELRLLDGATAGDCLRTSVRWSRLERVVELGTSTEDDEEDGAYDRPRPTTTAFLAIARRVDAALLKKLAARLSITRLAARIAHVAPLTVLQLYGAPEAELLPYGIAVALQHVLADVPPIALVELDRNHAARYLVLGEQPLRESGAADVMVARALDAALGRHPGTHVLQDVLLALAATPIAPLVGDDASHPLTMIDPASAPLVEDEPDDDYDDEPDEEDELWDDDGDEVSLCNEPPVVIEDHVEEPAIADSSEAIVEEVVEIVELDLERLALQLAAETEDALVPPPERPELWLEFRDHWSERAVDIDDEPADARWPDPELVANEYPLDLERQIAAPACIAHGIDLDTCDACGVLHCVECSRNDSHCTACADARESTTKRLPSNELITY